MPAKLTSESGAVIFEFENDKLMCALVEALICQAKFGEDLRATITLNPHFDALAAAVQDYRRRLHADTLAGRAGVSADMPEGVANWQPTPSWAQRVLTLIFEEAPALKWWTLKACEKSKILENAFFPHRLPGEVLEEFIESIDYRVSRYRADTKSE